MKHLKRIEVFTGRINENEDGEEFDVVRFGSEIWYFNEESY